MFEDHFSNTAIIPDCRIPEVDGQRPPSIQRAVWLLLKASMYAEDTGKKTWEFAVTIGELRREGIAKNELRWLVSRGYVEHAVELTRTGSERSFDRDVNLRFCKRSAFVITSSGMAYSREWVNGSAPSEVRDGVVANLFATAMLRNKPQLVPDEHQGSHSNACPKWDRDRRELRFGNKLIKVFKLPSPMQEAILMAFEEEHWPPRIDDPLPGHPDYPPKRRLHDTIKSLNRNQRNTLIRFMGDGTGEGIRWELVPALEPAECSNCVLQ
jgi:hypothetical protein